MVEWVHYFDLEPIRRLRNEGRELLGSRILLTEKRDGENVSLWLDNNKNVRISSHNQEDAAVDIQNRMKLVPEYPKIVELLNDSFGDYIVYGELLKTVCPTRIEPKRKNVHWILFDIFDVGSYRYAPYNLVYQTAYHYKIPLVRIVDDFIPENIDDLNNHISLGLKWCVKHRREGVVGKDYSNQIFFKEKIDLPKRPKLRKPQEIRVQYPSMPEDRILRALQHALDEVGQENWKNVKIAMPIVARHMETEAREHNFETPKNIYRCYTDTPLEKIIGVK